MGKDTEDKGITVITVSIYGNMRVGKIIKNLIMRIYIRVM